MGSDIYLYRYDVDPAEVQAREDEHEKASEQIWERIKGGRSYEELAESEKETASSESKSLAISMGLDKYGEWEAVKHKVDIDSSLYPEHLNKIGYFRSSYNSGGYNSLARDLFDGAHTLHDIFGHTDDEYIFAPDWNATLGRAAEAVKAWRELAKGPCFGVMKAQANPFGGNGDINSANDALNAYETQYRRSADERAKYIEEHPEDVKLEHFFGGSGYSNSAGDSYHFKPIPIVGIIHGTDEFLGRNLPCEYLIFQREDGYEWYRQAAEIVAETCQWVLAQPDIEKYRLHWSG